MILTEDLNLTGSIHDSLAGYFKSLFENVGLVDIPPNIMLLVWLNGKLGSASIENRLDNFFYVRSFM